MAQLRGVSATSSNAHREDDLKAKHQVFLSHSGFQKAFVEHLWVELEGCYRYPFFDKCRDSLPIGENFPQHIFDAIQQCRVGVVIFSDEFFTSKWPMMELVAMHNRVLDEVGRGESWFKIMPVFLRTSIKEFDDPKNHGRWLSCWQKLAMENPERVKVEKCEAALKYVRSINGLVYDGLSELRFQKEIVEEICRVVPPEIKYEDSHIEGRLRLCEVIREKINVEQKRSSYGVCVVGLYGMGGIGKTSICKSLCNEYFTHFRGRVCHAELERSNEEDLLREVLKNLTNSSRERLDGFKLDQLRYGLLEGIVKEKVFLALDNMSDTSASIQQAKRYLAARLPPGSIVMVTTRSKNSLTQLRPYIDEGKCLEMPDLVEEEARSLFIKSSHFELRNDADGKLINRCVKQCYFQKDNSNRSYHYHPLAMDVLGRQLGCIDPKEWGAQLDRIGEDIFNQGKEDNHPIFSILRKSYDTLAQDDQLLFMDIGLSLLGRNEHEGAMEWLGMVHRIPSVQDVMRRLERLKAKSLLETLGDGMSTRIGMHDLWRAFCVAETKYGELGCRRWVYEVNIPGELVETSPSGSCWENVRRMAFLGCELRSLEKVNFARFPNVTVLKISGLLMTKKLVVDLSRLLHLKSLEVSGEYLHNLVLQGLAKDLVYLSLEGLYPSQQLKAQNGFLGKRWKSRPDSQELMVQMGCFKELQCLGMFNFRGSKLPDMRSMVSIREAVFHECLNVVTVTGLSSKLINLRILHFKCCDQLRSCPGVGELVVLEELVFWRCPRLKRLPNLRKLKNLWKLSITTCPLISEVPGLDDLVALEVLYAEPDVFGKSSYTLQLPDMGKLRNLRVLDLPDHRLQAVPGFDKLISLQKVDVDFQEVVDRPSLRQLTKLQCLTIGGWTLEDLRGLDNLSGLHSLEVRSCSGVDELPDFQSLISLQHLYLTQCEFKDVSSLSNLSKLESLSFGNCQKLERLPDLQRLTRLKRLAIRDCGALSGWDGTLGRVEGGSCRLDGTSVGLGLLESQTESNSQALVSSRLLLRDGAIFGAFSQLEHLECGCLSVRELPDLSNFPRLEVLGIDSCRSLRRLTIREPMNALSKLYLWVCDSLATLPDLCNFPGLVELHLRRCDGITSLSSSGPLTALRVLFVDYCTGLKALPDLGMFPALEELLLNGCRGLTTLSSSVPLPALKELDARGCSSLSQADLDQLRASCPQCEIKCGALDEDAPIRRPSRILGCFSR